MAAPKVYLDRFSEIGDLALSVRRLISRSLFLLVALLVAALGYLAYTASPGLLCFAQIAAGSLIILLVWRKSGVGLPIVPIMGIQTLIAYGLPILNGNETVFTYSEVDLTHAGGEVLIFCGSLVAAWTVGLQIFALSSPLCYALQGFAEEKLGRLSRLGFQLIGAASSFEILTSLQLLDPLLAMLPSGAISLINVILSAVSACGFFLAAMLVGKGSLPAFQRVVFWTLFFIHCFISASAFLLSSTITIVFSVLIGLFWGGGRVPWRYLIVVLSLISFLNVGKFTMRERYWKTDTGADNIPTFALLEMPGYYAEWVDASLAALAPDDAGTKQLSPAEAKAKKGQSLSERINNLQNLLYVIDAMGNLHLQPLGGATYTLIPPLLVPRILWPDKPRTHEGQIMLNVHFGRQDLHSTMQTYIAWGLLAEGYGNFGPVAGAIFIGACLGFFFAWVEKYSARKLLLSMEGFLCFTLFLGMANSFEMVASVLVTSIFQAFIPIVLASKPFTEHVVPRRPDA